MINKIEDLKYLVSDYNLDEFKQEIIRLYDEYLMQTEKRGVSYGEIAHIEGLEENEAFELWQELYEYFGDDENGE